jgi:4-hydroxybenzoate polyprenyltransferase
MSSTSQSRAAGSASRTPLQTTALVVGVVFLLVGILGFIPGVTQDFDTITFAGHESDAKLLGIFEVSILHNLVHALFGIAGIAMARAWSTARTYLIGGGAIYLVLWLYGLLIEEDSAANFVPVNDADNWLHLVLGLGMIGVGVALSRDARSTRTA